MTPCWLILSLAVFAWLQPACAQSVLWASTVCSDSAQSQSGAAFEQRLATCCSAAYITLAAHGAGWSGLRAVVPEADDRWRRAGRDALRRGGFPWYDRSADAVRRIDVARPREPERSAPPIDLSAPLDAAIKWFFYTLLAAVLLIVAVMMLRAYLQYRAGKQDQQKTSIGRGELAGPLPFDAPHSELDFLAQARLCYRQGNYSQAIVYLFAYQLVQLDRHRIITLERGGTNRQYLRQVGHRGPLRQIMELTMTAFEDVFFGKRDLSQQQFERCWAALDQFERLLQQGAA